MQNDVHATAPPFYLPEFEQAFRWIIEEYSVSPRHMAIFLPCAMKKPYSTSPSHRLIGGVIQSICSEEDYHRVIFGTCGVVPAELESMYPFSSYRYMLGNCGQERIINDFLEIETYRIAQYLVKTKDSYQYRVAYCIGSFRKAMIMGARRSGIPLDLLLPSEELIGRMRNPDLAFPDGSLSMKEYIDEFQKELLVHVRDIPSR